MCIFHVAITDEDLIVTFRLIFIHFIAFKLSYIYIGKAHTFCDCDSQSHIYKAVCWKCCVLMMLLRAGKPFGCLSTTPNRATYQAARQRTAICTSIHSPAPNSFKTRANQPPCVKLYQRSNDWRSAIETHNEAFSHRFGRIYLCYAFRTARLQRMLTLANIS